MASASPDPRPAFSYIVVYVRDVAKSVAFYAKAGLGYNVRCLDDYNRWGELKGDRTTIAFTQLHQHETDDLTGVVQISKSSLNRQPVDLCFACSDVGAAFKRAVEKMGTDSWIGT